MTVKSGWKPDTKRGSASPIGPRSPLPQKATRQLHHQTKQMTAMTLLGQFKKGMAPSGRCLCGFWQPD
jgi:hypothetical protein